jgi:hypothetical protein
LQAQQAQQAQQQAAKIMKTMTRKAPTEAIITAMSQGAKIIGDELWHSQVWEISPSYEEKFKKKRASVSM